MKNLTCNTEYERNMYNNSCLVPPKCSDYCNAISIDCYLLKIVPKFPIMLQSSLAQGLLLIAFLLIKILVFGVMLIASTHQIADLHGTTSMK